MGEYFDELTKAVAKGVGRRQALVRLGVGLAGAAVAAIGMASPKVEAAPKRCRDFCQSFTGLVLGNCLRVCNTCAGGPSKTCFNYTSQSFTCCASGEGCYSGTCVS